MTPNDRTLAALRLLCRLHKEAGQVPLAELGILIAELESVPNEPNADRSRLGSRSSSELGVNCHGYPRGLERK